MSLRIIEAYSDCGVDIGRIVRRIVKYAPPDCLHGLHEISILDKDPNNIGFASYSKNERRIELYVKDILGWQPWFLKRSFVFPYLAIGIALGHEIDHHVSSRIYGTDKEKSAENNALRYVYPSFGIFKPIARCIAAIFGSRTSKQ